MASDRQPRAGEDPRWLVRLYDLATGDEDARVCKDIPDAACRDQPRNFFAYLVANLLGKVSDELASAKLVLPWLFGTLGVPALFTGFLVPIREAGALLPQLAVGAAVRRLPRRRGVWLLGAVLTGASLVGMAAGALTLEGAGAGAVLTLLLVLFSLSRGLCSVSGKDVLGKTISKSRRGRLMGWSTGLSGVAVLGIGLTLGLVRSEESGMVLFAVLLAGGGLLRFVAAGFFALIREQPGATEGGGNALAAALAQLRVLATDPPFRRFVLGRALLLSVALAPPFYVLAARRLGGGTLEALGALIIANGLAGALSAPFWGWLGDRSSRTVMALAAGGAGLLGVLTWAGLEYEWTWLATTPGLAGIFLVLGVMHGGVRLGRKVYLVDLASGHNRATYVAVSNTVIGVLMLGGGLFGLLGDTIGPGGVILVLSLLALAAAGFVRALPEVSEPE